MTFVGWGKMKTHEFRVGSNNYLICVRPGEKNYIVLLTAHTSFALRTTHFIYFSFFFWSLITNKVIIHGKEKCRLQSCFKKK